MLRPGRPSGVGSERAAGGLGTGTCGRAAALGLRAQLRSAGSSRGGTEVALEARRAGTRFPPRGLGGGRDGAGGGGGGGGAEGTDPQPLSRPPPPRARARAHPSRPAAAARARAHLRPPRKPGRLALRPHPIGSAHLRPRRQPIGTRLARRVGGPPSRKSRPPPRDWSRPAREGRDHLKPWASPDPAGEQEGACAGFGVSAPVRPAGSASAPGDERGGWAFCARAGARLVARGPTGARAPLGDGERCSAGSGDAAGLLGWAARSPLPLGDAAACSFAPPHPLASFRSPAATLLAKFKFSRFCSSLLGRTSGLSSLGFVRQVRRGRVGAGREGKRAEARDAPRSSGFPGDFS